MSNELQKTPAIENKRDIRNFITSDTVRAQMAMVLPKHLTADRMARVTLTAIMRVPKLLNCTQESLLNCLMQCSQMGLEPDGRRAHLIPFENKKKGIIECTLIVDWKGLAELAMRAGTIAKLHADLICENDEFSFDMGEILHHKINFRKERGQPYAVYAMATTKTGEKFVQVMTRAEVEAIRDNSQGWRAFKAGYTYSSPWQDAPGEMWKKTVFRRLSKWLVLSPEFRDAQEIDETTDLDATVMPPTIAMPDFGPPAQLSESPTPPAGQEPAPTPEAPRRGRPPGSRNAPLPAVTPIEATVTPEPQPEAAKPSAAQPSQSTNFLKGVKGLMALESITESELLDFGRETKDWDETLSSLEEVAMAAPSKLEQAYNEWAVFAKAIKAARHE